MQKYNDAEKQYLKILDQYPLYDELNLAYLKLGETYEAEHRWKEAHAAFQNLVDRYPKAFEVAEAKAQMREMEKKHAELPRSLETRSPAPSSPVVSLLTSSPAVGPQPSPAVEVAPSLSKGGKTALTVEFIPKPFHVQIGVYSKKYNVEKARKALRKAGFNPYLLVVKQEAVPYTIYKVRVGNFADRASAEKAARAVSRKIREKAIAVED